MARNDTIMVKMQRVMDALKTSLERVDELERKLSTKLLTVEHRERLENELEEVKEVLRRNEEKLHSLRKQNTMSFIIAACLIFACFLVYGLYLMFFKGL